MWDVKLITKISCQTGTNAGNGESSHCAVI